jgi:hypothetical protein
MQKTCEKRRRCGEKTVMLKRAGGEELPSTKFLLPPSDNLLVTGPCWQSYFLASQKRSSLNRAAAPNSVSMIKSRLYLAMRSERDTDPVLI